MLVNRCLVICIDVEGIGGNWEWLIVVKEKVQTNR